MCYLCGGTTKNAMLLAVSVCARHHQRYHDFIVVAVPKRNRIDQCPKQPALLRTADACKHQGLGLRVTPPFFIAYPGLGLSREWRCLYLTELTDFVTNCVWAQRNKRFLRGGARVNSENALRSTRQPIARVGLCCREERP